MTKATMTNLDDVHLVTASPLDAEVLSIIQREAFDSGSADLHMSWAAGPDGYDTLDGMKDLSRCTDLLKIIYKGTTVGGAAVIDSGDSCRLVRMFLDPAHQGKGVGQRTFERLLERFPNANTWELDAPSWSLRNHRFYEGLGFLKVGETDKGDRGFSLFLFERRKMSGRP
jgi:GNAT superfamily N-acetyltransferase